MTLTSFLRSQNVTHRTSHCLLLASIRSTARYAKTIYNSFAIARGNGRNRATSGTIPRIRDFGSGAGFGPPTLNDPIIQPLTPLEPSQVVHEVLHEPLVLVVVPTRRVRRDEAVRRRPQRVIGRERFGRRDVDVRGGERFRL